MLLELAIGDAYGAGMEYVKPDFVRTHNHGRSYVAHPRHGIAPGCYTDDTQMSLALAEMIVEGESWTAQNIAQRFVTAFQRDPREGYARGFYQFLQGVRDGEDFLARIRNDSDKSGSAMRAGPVGVFRNIEEVLERSATQAAVTHDTPDGIHAAQAAALMTHYFIWVGAHRTELPQFIAAHVPGHWTEPWRGRVGAKGYMSVRAAITAIVEYDRLSTILRACVDFGGDVDTVATIALAAAACSDDIVQDLPSSLIRGLENATYGRDHLRKIDRLLLATNRGA